MAPAPRAMTRGYSLGYEVDAQRSWRATITRAFGPGARPRYADSPSRLDHRAALALLHHRSPGRLQCLRKSAHDLVDLLLGHDERRRDHHEVAVRPVGVPHVGPHYQPRLLRGLGERLGEMCGAWQQRARRLVLHELDPGEQPAPAHVTHVRQRP